MNDRLQTYKNHVPALMRREPLLFLLIAVLNLIPAVKPEFFPTLDGPAHLYNAKIIGELISEPHGFFSRYIEFNPIAVPNAAGHYLLWLLNLVFSPSLSSRIMTGGYLLLLPFAFRYCVLRFSPRSITGTYLAFPFTYAFTFCMGFYNYHLGLIALLFAVGMTAGFFDTARYMRKAVALLLLMTLAYFCHVIIFCAAGIFIALTALFALFRRMDSKKTGRKVLVLFVACLPGLLLSLVYLRKVPPTGGEIYQQKYELIGGFTGFRSLICYRQETELLYTSVIFIVLIALAGIAAAALFKTGAGHEKPALAKKLRNNILLLCSALFFVLYMNLPDHTSNGGLISTRLGFICMLFLALWVAGAEIPRRLMAVSVIIVLFCQLKLVRDHSSAFRDQSADLWQYREIAKHIQPETSLVGVNIGSWLGGHNSNYVGLYSKVLVLDNYELFNDYFPLRWKKSRELAKLRDNDGKPFIYAFGKGPDYVLLGQDSNWEETRETLKEHYDLYARTPKLRLYRKKGRG
jgi:hypothetical protein